MRGWGWGQEQGVKREREKERMKKMAAKIFSFCLNAEC